MATLTSGLIALRASGRLNRRISIFPASLLLDDRHRFSLFAGFDL